MNKREEKKQMEFLKNSLSNGADIDDVVLFLQCRNAHRKERIAFWIMVIIILIFGSLIIFYALKKTGVI